jgi:hypothetical protein
MFFHCMRILQPFHHKRGKIMHLFYIYLLMHREIRFLSELIEGLYHEATEPALAYQFSCIYQRIRMALCLLGLCTCIAVRPEGRLFAKLRCF